LQTPGRPTPRTLVLTIAATLAFAQASQAQEATQSNMPAEQPELTPELTPEQQALSQDFYRAELVILERKIKPSAVEEKMAGRLPEPPNLEAEDILRHTDKTGATQTTLKLVPHKELHLNTAAERLENSGRYRILLNEGWYQAFPPDFEGKPLWVTIGDWLPGAQHTDVQGMITIDRRRYLHVNVQLNHWLPKPPTENLLGIDLNTETPTHPHLRQISIQPVGSGEKASEELSSLDSAEIGETPAKTEQTEPPLIAELKWPRAELLTWIRETRRMRSEEVHFLDSPTLGVLIFFKKIEPEDAVPLIRKLGLGLSPELELELELELGLELKSEPEPLGLQEAP
jgi:hypothetical protein